MALVKKPHIELSIHGEHVDELLAWIRKKYDLAVLVSEPDDELVSIESTDYWAEMEKNRIGSVIVTEKGKAVGIVTERDIVRRVVSAKKKPTVTLKRIMSSPLRVTKPSQEVEDAVIAMRKHGIKKLAVVDEIGRAHV